MTNYLLLYSGGRMPATEDEQQAVMKAWTDWFAQIGDAPVDGGNPTTPNAKMIGNDGTVTDGANGMSASGYSIIKANSQDEAVAMAKGCPVLQRGAKLTVLETFQVM